MKEWLSETLMDWQNGQEAERGKRPGQELFFTKDRQEKVNIIKDSCNKKGEIIKKAVTIKLLQ